MLRRVRAAGAKVHYLLMNSWIGLPAIISALCPMLPVVCMVKQFLGLEKGCQAREFDSLIAHVTIVLMRPIILSVEQRPNRDPQTLGLLFHACSKAMRDLCYLKSLMRILELTRDRMNSNNCWPISRVRQ